LEVPTNKEAMAVPDSTLRDDTAASNAAAGPPPRPAALPVLFDNIPAELRELPQWLVWKYQLRDGNWTKPPYNARTGQLADSTDPATWSRFDEARAAYERGGWDGVGVVNRPEDKVTGADGDGCRDAATGELAAWAGKVVRLLDTYTEVSPSAEGVRAFARGVKPGRRCRKDGLELYDGMTAEGKPGGRYLTVTGHRLPGSPETVNDRQPQINALYEQTFHPAKEPAKGSAKKPETGASAFRPKAYGGECPLPLTDDELARWNCLASDKTARIRALWQGDISGNENDDSRADLALVKYLLIITNGDEQRARELFDQSILGQRAKWKERADYRDRTFEMAAEGFRPWQDDPARNGTADGAKASANGHAKPDAPLLTDVGNARRLVGRHGNDLLYAYVWKGFLTWDGRRWAPDETGAAVRMVKETQSAFYREIAGKLQKAGDPGDDEAGKKRLAQLTAMLSHAKKWQDARRVAATLEMAKSEPGVPVLPADLDRDPMLLNVANGTLDLRTGRLRDHDRTDLLTKLAPVTYDPDATCPLWERFLERIMDGNADLITYLQRVVGYGLTGDVSEQAVWFLYGTGANGKSTFLATLLALLGDYGMQAVSELLMAKAHESHPTERADLFGKRFVCTIETEQGKHVAEALMKQLTGGDKVRARRMRQDFFEFEPTHKILLAANHKPVIRGTDHGCWRRVKMLPFTVTIPEAEKDKHLADKLRAELSGILNWAVRGCRDWQEHGLGEPEEVKVATDAYRAEQDMISGFIAECCLVNAQARAKASALFDAYCAWSGDKYTTQKAFGQRLREKGYEGKRGHGGAVWYHGVAIDSRPG
jgi:putative DNA primase/helicase